MQFDYCRVLLWSGPGWAYPKYQELFVEGKQRWRLWINASQEYKGKRKYIRANTKHNKTICISYTVCYLYTLCNTHSYQTKPRDFKFKNIHLYELTSSNIITIIMYKLTDVWRWSARRSRHYCDDMMAAMASQITSLTIIPQPFIQAQIKENIKAPCHWPLCGEFTVDRWIPRTNGPVMRKMFPFDDVIMETFYNQLIFSRLRADKALHYDVIMKRN